MFQTQISGLCVSHLVRVHQSGVREVEGGDEQPDTLALHPVTIQVVRDDAGHIVLAGAGPTVEGERERLVGLWVVDETLGGFQDHGLSQVLPVELHLKVPGQTCTMCAHKRTISATLQCSALKSPTTLPTSIV